MQLTKTALFFLALVPFLSWARHDYYPQQYQQKFERSQLQGAELKQALFNILNEYHLRVPGQTDELGCPKSMINGPQKSRNCYRQESLSYRYARKQLFGQLHLKRGSEGYYIKEVYCNEVVTERDDNIGKGKIPSHTNVNTEHTWPQSKFTGRFSRGLQKGDLHHLFPTNSKANSIRSSYPFSDVDGGEIDGCRASAIGHNRYGGGRRYFEPADSIKGDVARAVFYFSVRYQMHIPSVEEDSLKRWHNQDPVSEEELERNDGVYEIQGNRNPFIDYPELVDLIADF